MGTKVERGSYDRKKKVAEESSSIDGSDDDDSSCLKKAYQSSRRNRVRKTGRKKGKKCPTITNDRDGDDASTAACFCLVNRKKDNYGHFKDGAVARKKM